MVLDMLCWAQVALQDMWGINQCYNIFRPNFKDVGLNFRAMQNAGVIEHSIKCFAPATNDPWAEFREWLNNRDFAREKTEEENTRYKMLQDQLMIDTPRKSSGIVITLSKTVDNKFKNAKKLVVAIIDEACHLYRVGDTSCLDT